jgi:hypothetical protein
MLQALHKGTDKNDTRLFFANMSQLSFIWLDMLVWLAVNCFNSSLSAADNGNGGLGQRERGSTTTWSIIQ